ncbi:MAG: thioredoxin [Legionellales bacterium]|nr:thioredoxin [Legionellales bacterium]|tara:strand:- start:988 stop:1320 length:333 start_codon:yes stop_codon:yes gene_type:complete
MGQLLEVTTDAFEAEVLQSETPVLVDFWAPWCGPCRMIMPILEEASEALSKVARIVKVNVDEEQALAVKYGVRGIPALLLFRDGQLVENKVGSLSKQQIIDFVNESLSED